MEGARKPYPKKQEESGRSEGPRKPYGRKQDEPGRSEETRRPYARRQEESGRSEETRGPYARRQEESGRSEGSRKPYGRRQDEPGRSEETRRPYAKRQEESGRSEGPRKPYGRRQDEPGRSEETRRPYARRQEESGRSEGPRKPYGRRQDEPGRSEETRRPYARRQEESGSSEGPRKPYGRRQEEPGKPEGTRRPYAKRQDEERPVRRRSTEQEGKTERSDGRRPYVRQEDRDRNPRYKKEDERGYRSSSGRTGSKKDHAIAREGMRLNKYIAHAGICSRREADTLIASGVVQVNGKVITEMGYKVMTGDKVQLGEQTLRAEKLFYVALNKPKGYITTTDDPEERRTVMELVREACRERIYPVGRLDRNTTGVLLLTNDGEMAKKLTHPRHGVRKIYHVHLDRNLSKKDMEQIVAGVELEDGLVKVDDIAWVEGANDKKQIGITLHSGRNRIVRRLFEHLGYEVVKLDRVSFAGITKKLIPRGKWRHLSQEEINILKRLK
ncbi:MAG: RNA-binding S4 domain-containing protein [Lentimicrobiaceae bacterium]|nr:RNA-binding S4 domain-containing protein [Lentimicrobiaceae bacterium]